MGRCQLKCVRKMRARRPKKKKNPKKLLTQSQTVDQKTSTRVNA